jgi:S-(hydroxymethyl)glutathione dehydrogenase/alcohol dehydrogenase
MRAALLVEPNAPLVVEEVTIDPPRTGEVLVRITASGVCHSDYHMVTGAWSGKLPIVLGHEGAGVVDEVGPGVTGLEPGDTVALSWTPSCRRCRFCVTGRPQLCTQASRLAYDNLLQDGTTRIRRGDQEIYPYLSVGSFAEYAVVPESGVVKVPTDVDPAIAALVGCAITTGVGAAMNTQPIPPGASVLVVGAGGVGLSVIQGANLQSPSRIIAVDLSAERLDLAREFGATHTVDGADPEVLDRIVDLTDGGVDIAFEAIGNPKTIELAYSALAPGGTTVVVGQVPTGKTITIDPMRMSGRELTLKGSNYGSARPSVDFPRILGLQAEGRLKLDRMVSARLPLDAINEAFELMRQGSGARTVIEMSRAAVGQEAA